MGYDETTRTLIVFGGESESGFPTSGTYLYVPSLYPSIAKANAHRTTVSIWIHSFGPFRPLRVASTVRHHLAVEQSADSIWPQINVSAIS